MCVGGDGWECHFLSTFLKSLHFSQTIFLNIYLFYLFSFLAVLGLCCCARAFSSCGEWGLLFIEVHELLIVVASLVAEHRL